VAEGNSGVSVVEAFDELGGVLVGTIARFIAILCRNFRRQP
jgi:hypothetical protein